MAGVFDKTKIADLAQRIEAQSAEVAALRERYGKLGSELNGAETRLANLRMEFTRAVDGHLDMTTLKQRAPVAADQATTLAEDPTATPGA